MTSILVSVILAFTLSTIVLFIVTRRPPQRRVTPFRDVKEFDMATFDQYRGTAECPTCEA